MEKAFLMFALRLTGEPVENIKVLKIWKDSEGRMSGTIEIDGNIEFIHEGIA